jgi:heme-binding protein
MHRGSGAEGGVTVAVRKRIRTVALVLTGGVGVVSLISNSRPAVNAEAPLLAGALVPPDVRFAIERSCRDCHSDATRYPWYSYVAPVSWLVNRDIARGRERLNFSKWSEYPTIRRERFLSDIANQVQDGGMPLSIYTLMHRDAKLSKADIDAVFQWTQSERGRLIMESAGAPTSK